VVTICTTSLTFSNSTFCPHTVFMCSVWISEQTAIISLHNINSFVSITDPQSVYCAVRTHTIHICNPSSSQCCLSTVSTQSGRSCHRLSQPQLSWFFLSLQANAHTVPSIPSCHCILLLTPCQLKATKINPLALKPMKINFQIMHFIINQNS